MAKGKLNIQAADGAVIGLIVPDGLGSGERQIALGVNLSGITAYHLLQGNLSVSNEVLTNGFSTTLYTSGSVTTNIDMSTQWGNDASEKFGGLVWLKDRVEATNHFLYDTVRGATKEINSNTTEAEATLAGGLTAFTSTGFTVGADAGHNSTTNNMVSWNFQTTHRVSGVTNHGKAYTCHYNPFTGFTMIKYEGSGLAGHEIPHSLGRKLGFVTVKNLSAVTQCFIKPYSDSINYMALNTTDALNSGGASGLWSNGTDNLFIVNTDAGSNTSTNQYILYGWANSYFDESNKLIGNYEIGVYQGIGAAGNKVTTRGKPAWVMIKRLDSTSNWYISDNQRVSGDNLIIPNSSAAEFTGTNYFDYMTDGFIIKNTAADLNASGGQYLYMVVYDNDSGSGKSKYPKATDITNLSINALVPYANGIDVNGSKVSIEYKNETITGLTLTEGKNYLYSKNDGTYGTNKYEPMYGSLRNRNVAGENPDYFDLKTMKWYGTSGGSELVTNGTFDSNITGWTGANATLSWVSNSIRATTTGDYSSVSQIVSGLTIGKKYRFKANIALVTAGQFLMRIWNVSSTVNYFDNGWKTISQEAYIDFIAPETSLIFDITGGGLGGGAGKVYSVDNISVFELAPTIGAEITPRTYLDCVVYADHNGQVSYVEELPKTTYFDIVKANEFKGKNACTAWANIDMTTTPPTIKDGHNIGSVIRTSAGNGDIYFKEAMDNINYTIFSGNGMNIASNISSNTGHSKTLNMFKIAHWENGTTYNLPDLYIYVIGGKN